MFQIERFQQYIFRLFYRKSIGIEKYSPAFLFLVPFAPVSIGYKYANAVMFSAIAVQNGFTTASTCWFF